MKCTERKKKLLLYLTEKLMTGAGIELRDTWKGIEKETFEVTFISGEGACTFDAEKDVAVGYKSLTYTNPIFTLPELYGDTAHQLIHEAVHFLQHNDWEMDKAYFQARKFSPEGFKEFISQRAETEAHFIQLVFIARYESHLIKVRELTQFRNRIRKAIQNPAMRISTICWFMKNDILIRNK